MPGTRNGATRLRTFDQAVALVTGGASGIGAALARGLVARGAHVILADRDEDGRRHQARGAGPVPRPPRRGGGPRRAGQRAVPGVIRTPILEYGGRYGRARAFMDLVAQRRLWERLRPMDPDRFAGKVLAAVARNRAIIVVPWWWRVLRLLNAVLPSLGDAMAPHELRRVRALMRPRPPKA